jgi:hypothetical protein
MEEMLAALEAKVASPVLVAKGDRRVFRYEDKSAPQAIVQKSARVVSGIGAADILMERGYLQEGAVLIRVVSEMIEDVRFLSKAVITGEVPEFLEAYLRAFYEEAIPGDGDVVTALNRKRTRISRRDVRAADARCNAKFQVPLYELPTSQLSRALANLFSEFVHGSSSQIMGMYGGNPPRFHVAGMPGTPPQADYQRYFDEVILSAAHAFSLAAVAFGDGATKGKADELVSLLQNPATVTGPA